MRATTVAGLLMTLAGGASALLAADRAPLRFEPYVLRGFDGVERPAEIARLSVPARRAQPASPAIELAVLRLRSTAAAPSDPIVFLMGGPGIPASVMGQVPVYAQLFERLRSVADVILLDQRGTGLSRPLLECPPREKPLGPDAFLSQAALVREMRSEIDACLASQRAKGVDPAGYTSSESAADVADLRQALGAKRLDLLGYSYGTEVALAVMRRHGDVVGRSVLAGTRGPDHAVKLPGVFDLKLRQVARLATGAASLRGVLEDEHDFLSRVSRIVDASAGAPLRVTVKDGRSGQPVELRIGREGLRMLMLQWLDSPRFPALVASLDRGDTRVLARLAEPLYNSLGRGGSSLMARAVNCSTGASPARRARAAAEAEWSLLGAPFDNLMLSPEYCEGTGAAASEADSWRPFASPAPTLLISGSLDGNTPPAQAEEVRFGLSNAAHLVVRLSGHEMLPIPDVQQATLDFFAGQDVAGRVIQVQPPAYLGVEDAANRPCAPREC